MKKIVLFAFVAFSLAANAQHVTPLSVELTEINLDSLRTLYMQQPTMYRAALDVLSQELAKDAEEIKTAKKILKGEQTHAKEKDNVLKEGTKMAASLKGLYAKEESELKSMQKIIETQQKTVVQQTELTQEARDSYMEILDAQQKELGYSLREIAERNTAIMDIENMLQNAQSSLQGFIQETQQKAAELAQLEATHKERVNMIKQEQKADKSMQ